MMTSTSILASIYSKTIFAQGRLLTPNSPKGKPYSLLETRSFVSMAMTITALIQVYLLPSVHYLQKNMVKNVFKSLTRSTINMLVINSKKSMLNRLLGEKRAE